MTASCKRCGVAFNKRRASHVYCSRRCLWTGNGGQNRKSEVWWVNNRGYIEGRVMIAGKQRRVKQHRWVMEQHLGRPLAPSEDVHHLNGDKTDNRVANLALISHGDHSTLTGITVPHKRGHRLNLSETERKARADRARKVKPWLNSPRSSARAARGEP